MKTQLKLAVSSFVGAFMLMAPLGDIAFAGPVGLGEAAVAPVSAPVENVGYYCCYYRHHHCCYYHRHHHHHHWGMGGGYFTGLTGAGTVSYPIYRIDHYKIDYRSPTYGYTSGGGWIW